MKLTVEVHGLDKFGKPTLFGEIVWDGETMKASNTSQRLKTIMTLPVRAEDGTRLMPKDNPRFIRALNLQYRSAYLQCSEAE